MGERSAIEWTDASWNPLWARAGRPDGSSFTGWHCEPVSEGCRNCYAEVINRRLGTRLDYKPGNLIHENKFRERRGHASLFLDEAMLLAPLRWRRPRKIFVGSMTDLFGDWVSDEMLDRVFAVMALAPQHVFQLLTKRPERMRAYLTERNGMGNAAVCRAINAIPAGLGNRHGALEMPLPNVWLGVSVEDQNAANERIPRLLDTPSAVRFLSCEPLLGPVDLRAVTADGDTELNALRPTLWEDEVAQWRDSSDDWVDDFEDHYGVRIDKTGPMHPPVDWVIAGYESGPKARAGHPEIARSLRDQCAAASVPFLFKQWGAFAPLRGALPAEPGSPGLAAWPDGSVRTGTGLAQAMGAGITMFRGTKKITGRLLDGVLHDGMPG